MPVVDPLSPLTAERACFENHYHEFVRDHSGEVVLISGSEILGFFKSLPQAEETAYRRHGLFDQPFLLRTILPPEEEERAETYQRMILAELT